VPGYDVPGITKMKISNFLAKVAFNGLMLSLPLIAAATVSYDVYSKGFSSPFASLFSAFVGLYVGFMVIWKMLCWADEVFYRISRTNARAAVKLRAIKRAITDWEDVKTAHA
jgi:hypothetical protein